VREIPVYGSKTTWRRHWQAKQRAVITRVKRVSRQGAAIAREVVESLNGVAAILEGKQPGNKNYGDGAFNLAWPRSFR
jgi:hypothetical protein